MMSQPLPLTKFYIIHLANDEKKIHILPLFYWYYCDVTLKRVVWGFSC